MGDTLSVEILKTDTLVSVSGEVRKDELALA
jgi:hypothetical protein